MISKLSLLKLALMLSFIRSIWIDQPWLEILKLLLNGRF